VNTEKPVGPDQRSAKRHNPEENEEVLGFSMKTVMSITEKNKKKNSKPAKSKKCKCIPCTGLQGLYTLLPVAVTAAVHHQ